MEELVENPPERVRGSHTDKAVMASATTRSEVASESDRAGLPCAVVDDDGRARGGVHVWQQLLRVPRPLMPRPPRPPERNGGGASVAPRRDRGLGPPRVPPTESRRRWASYARSRGERFGIGWRLPPLRARRGEGGRAARVAWRWGEEGREGALAEGVKQRGEETG
jgi:hypothetical protein